MTYQFEKSSGELARVGTAAYAGKRVRVSLANAAGTAFTVESTKTQWDTVKCSGNGYADFTGTIGAGAYDSALGQYDLGPGATAGTSIPVTFGPATGSGISFDTIVVVIANGTSEYSSVMTVSMGAPTLIASGQSMSFPLMFGIKGVSI
jgi:hypothetical protein